MWNHFYFSFFISLALRKFQVMFKNFLREEIYSYKFNKLQTSVALRIFYNYSFIEEEFYTLY